MDNVTGGVLMKPSQIQAVVFLAAGVALWMLAAGVDALDSAARVGLCVPVAIALCSLAWTQWKLRRQLAITRTRAVCTEMAQRNRIADLQHCFLDTLIAMDLGLQRCSRLADRDNHALADELEYLQEGIRELKRTTLETPGKDYWLTPLV